MAIITNPVSIRNVARELGIVDSLQCNLIDMVEDTSRINLMSKCQPGSNQGTNYLNLINFQKYNRSKHLPGTSKYEDPQHPEYRLEATRNAISKPYNLKDWLNYNSTESVLEVNLPDAVLRPGHWTVNTLITQIDKERAAAIIGAPLSRCKYGYVYAFSTSFNPFIGGDVIMDGGWPLGAMYNNITLPMGGVEWYMNNDPSSDETKVVYVMPVIWDSNILSGDSIKHLTNKNLEVTIIPNKENQVIYKRYDIGVSSQLFRVLIKTGGRINLLNPWDISISFSLLKIGESRISNYSGTLMGLPSGTAYNTSLLYLGDLNIPQGSRCEYSVLFSISVPGLSLPTITYSTTRGISVSGSFPSRFFVTATLGGVLTISCS